MGARPRVNLALFVVFGSLMLESTMVPIPSPAPSPIRVPAATDPVALRARMSWISYLGSEIERSTPACLLWQINPFSSAESKAQRILSLVSVIRMEVPALRDSMPCHAFADCCAIAAVEAVRSRVKLRTRWSMLARMLRTPFESSFTIAFRAMLSKHCRVGEYRMQLSRRLHCL